MPDVGNVPAALSQRQGPPVTDAVPVAQGIVQGIVQELALISPDGATYLLRVRTFRRR